MGTKPPLWRRFEFASDMFRDEVHDIIQVAFGWTDSHLHRFGAGPEFYSPETEYYLCPFDVAEGEPGVAEGEVRLDGVLVDVGDRLLYTYDFGDDWHTINLEAIRDRERSCSRAVCTGGRRHGPAEDCGGVLGYELAAAATDLTHPDPAAVAAEFVRVFGDDVDPAVFATTPFDKDAINDALAGLGVGAASTAQLPQALQELVEAVQTTRGRRELRRLIGRARVGEPVEIDAQTAAGMVRRYVWLLDRVGVGGIELTGVGYLPPVRVEAAVAELGLDAEWIGKGSRENQTLPVLDLRESARKMGLVRRHRGRVVLTPRASLAPPPA